MRTDRAFPLRVLALGAALSLLAGCPGRLSDKERFLVDAGEGDSDVDAGNGACGDVVARIFIPSCGGTGCHSAVAPQQGLDLESPGVASRIVGVVAKGCPVKLADPASPNGSLMYQKLSANPPCGSQMPLARPPLSEADAACIFNWIAAQGGAGGGGGGSGGGASGGSASGGGAP